MVKSNLHGHTKQIGYPESCMKRKTHRDNIVAWANKQTKKGYMRCISSPVSESHAAIKI